jgi:hypothetical protein
MDQFQQELRCLRNIVSYYDREPIERYDVEPTTRVQMVRGAEYGLHTDVVQRGSALFWGKS